MKPKKTVEAWYGPAGQDARSWRCSYHLFNSYYIGNFISWTKLNEGRLGNEESGFGHHSKTNFRKKPKRWDWWVLIASYLQYEQDKVLKLLKVSSSIKSSFKLKPSKPQYHMIAISWQLKSYRITQNLKSLKFYNNQILMRCKANSKAEACIVMTD